MTLPISTPQRRSNDRTRSRRARCTAAKRPAATELRRAAERAQAVLAEDAPATTTTPDRAPRTTGRATSPAASARSARVADAVVAQWLLEPLPRVRARRAVA